MSRHQALPVPFGRGHEARNVVRQEPEGIERHPIASDPRQVPPLMLTFRRGLSAVTRSAPAAGQTQIPEHMRRSEQSAAKIEGEVY